jgi:hypothetical protein
MTTTRRTTPIGATFPPASCAPDAPAGLADLATLRNTITTLNACSQEGFGRIEALARITLLALESPQAYRFPELVAQALASIADMAQVHEDCISSAAEEVGCSHIDPGAEYRRTARAKASQMQEGGAA